MQDGCFVRNILVHARLTRLEPREYVRLAQQVLEPIGRLPLRLLVQLLMAIVHGLLLRLPQPLPLELLGPLRRLRRPPLLPFLRRQLGVVRLSPRLLLGLAGLPLGVHPRPSPPARRAQLLPLLRHGVLRDPFLPRPQRLLVGGEALAVVTASVLLLPVEVGLPLGVGEGLPSRRELLHCVAHGGAGSEAALDVAEVVGLVEHEGRSGAVGRRHGCSTVCLCYECNEMKKNLRF
mmetsp:Transcript_4184/g.8910  ORF Transcript_4184/g.8910 Transcript_4184/m.8910 type:complete len:234 (-) Transcript_4184:278-979(-)